MDVAEIMVVGAVTEFEPEAGGGGINLGIAQLPFSFGRQTSNAHMAIDIRVVDIASGRVLGSKRIKGEASSSQTSVGLAPKTSDGGRIPISLGSFKNTPMEAAIRGCIEQSIDFIANTVPRKYYRVQ
jgi:curli biogenesis system outer membrane secretion channel CsgG